MKKENVIKVWNTVKDAADIINAITVIIAITEAQILEETEYYTWLKVIWETAISMMN